MPEPEDDRPIADAASFFDDPHHRSPDREPADDPSPDLGGYDLADHGPVPGSTAEAGPASPTPPVPPPAEKRPRPVKRPEPKQLTPTPVDRPWSRLSEWGPALSRIGLVLLATVVLAYLTFTPAGWFFSLAILAVGFGIGVLLSYPIAITLERPVRMTPEHAIRDYFSALAHHIPQYRRMWLLLSSAGHAEPEYGSYAEFRAYWNRLLSELKRGKGGAMSPVSVRIEDYKSEEKSAGLEAIEATFSIAIYLRGRESEGPLHATRADTTLSRGPDRMWYLDDGRLPGR